jgi:DNA-binding transcriptional regulator YhcF (GntR family)
MAGLSKPDGIPLYVKIRKSPQEDISNNILIPGQKIPSSLEKLGALTKTSLIIEARAMAYWLQLHLCTISCQPEKLYLGEPGFPI